MNPKRVREQAHPICLIISILFLTVCDNLGGLKRIGIQMDKPSKEFLDWSSKLVATPKITFSIQEVWKTCNATYKENFSENFFKQISENLQGKESFDLALDMDIGSALIEPTIDGKKRNYNTIIETCRIDFHLTEILTFKNLSIRNLLIFNNTRYNSLKFYNCNIANLMLSKNSKKGGIPEEKQSVSINIIDSFLGDFSIGSSIIESLNVTNGFILEFTCPPPHKINPFNGSVEFNNVYFPTNKEKLIYRDAQPFRNMRYHMKMLENTPMSNFFHTLELRAERNNDTQTNKAFSYLYDWFSGYGSSILKPFLWLLGFWLTSVTLFYFTDGLTTLETTKTNNLYIGWRSIFLESGQWATLSKAMYHSLIDIANPLGIFGAKSLLVPTNGWLAAWSIFHSLFSVIFITLTILSIRRRFKLQ